jgi:hypothetical protein
MSIEIDWQALDPDWLDQDRKAKLKRRLERIRAKHRAKRLAAQSEAEWNPTPEDGENGGRNALKGPPLGGRFTSKPGHFTPIAPHCPAFDRW